MPRVLWPLRHDQPSIQIVLRLVASGQDVVRHLLADTGAGTNRSGFELLLPETDCLQAHGNPLRGVRLSGAYLGSFPLYLIRVQIPALGFDRYVRAVGVLSAPPGMDGVAAFGFLNRFSYGNFGDPGQFGLEV